MFIQLGLKRKNFRRGRTIKQMKGVVSTTVIVQNTVAGILHSS